MIRTGGEAADILVVDDFADTLALYEALLSDDGHSVRVAKSGAEALARVEEREPELVLLDVSMPGMNGLEVLSKLRTRRGGGPAVVMLTAAHRDPAAIEDGLKRGADAYLTKPIDSRELLARCRAQVESFRLRRLLEAERRDHIAMLVHDLRHPLSSLTLIAEILEGDLSEAERRDIVVQIRTLSGELSRLVDSVLVASRLEAGIFSVDVSPLQLSELWEPMGAVFGPLCQRRRIDLSFEGDSSLTFSADGSKLRQALDNLLANSVKFTPKGGRIVFCAREMEEGTLTFEVRDTGPGIPEAEQKTVFDRYKQGARGRVRGGAGLGLAIARGIAEAHGGRITLESEPGNTVFRLTIPKTQGAG